MSLSDPIEQFENVAEAMLEGVTEGLPTGKFRCDCGKVCDLSQAYPAYNSPYAPPICSDCAEKEIK